MPDRYRAGDLAMFASALLERTGLARDRARVVADVLVEADLLGRTTHGLDLLPAYLRALESGGMARTGEPAVVFDAGAALTLDAQRLPGPWVVKLTIADALNRLAAHPVVTVAIRRSHHIACLQAYLKPVTDAGRIILLMSSDPSTGGVAPYGGVASVLTPNPIAAGFPTAGDPVLIDVSMSPTSNSAVKRAAARGERLPAAWLIDEAGRATDDPSPGPAGAPKPMLPLGGLDAGHKGFALGLLVEALTSGLGGYGRAEKPTEWTASIFLQLIDPDAFGGRETFVREAQAVAELCRKAAVPPGQPPVRLPGERALALRRRQIREGVDLYEGTMPALLPWGERFGVRAPAAIGTP